MRFDLKKSFGYPVLRKASFDYVDAGLTASVDLSSADEGASNEFVADYSIMLGVRELKKALDVGDLVVVMQFFSPRTFYSDVFVTSELRGQKVIDLSGVRGDLIVTIELVVAVEKFCLCSPKIHPEFGGGNARFELVQGEVVAQPEPISFYIDREIFKPVTSLFRWAVDEDIESGHWEISWMDDYVTISVSPDQRAILEGVQGNHRGQAILLNSIFVPAMAKLIEQVVSEPDWEWLWARTISQKLINVSVDPANAEVGVDSIKFAQLLLQQPLRRLNKVLVED